MTIFRPTKPTTLSWALTWRNKPNWDHQGSHSRLVDHQEGQESSLVSIPTKLFATENIKNYWIFCCFILGFFCGRSRILTTIYRDIYPNCWIQMMLNPYRSPTSTTGFVGKYFKNISDRSELLLSCPYQSSAGCPVSPHHSCKRGSSV